MITHDIAEAISMADRVVVLTGRPSKVKCIYNIEMKNKSNPISNRNQPEFRKYYDMIWKDIDIHVQPRTQRISEKEKKEKTINYMLSNTTSYRNYYFMGITC